MKPAKTPRLTIGRVARLSGVGVETIRYYERTGIITQPSRSMASFREYSEDTVNRVRFIKRAQELGFSLKEITELLSIRSTGGRTCARVSEQAERKLKEIREKISDLRRIEKGLTEVRDVCNKQGQTSKCHVLERFYYGRDRDGVLQGLPECSEGSGCS